MAKGNSIDTELIQKLAYTVDEPLIHSCPTLSKPQVRYWYVCALAARQPRTAAQWHIRYYIYDMEIFFP